MTPQPDPLPWADIRKAITDSYYDTRNEGGTMEAAADLAATRVVNLMSQRQPVQDEPGLREALDEADRVWFHRAHGLHDDRHHQRHRSMDVCVPLIMVTNALRAALRATPARFGAADLMAMSDDEFAQRQRDTGMESQVRGALGRQEPAK